MEQSPNRHIIVLLLSAAFILAQFIVELIFISFLINIVPAIGTFLYNSSWFLATIHIIITVVLLWYAGKCRDRYCVHCGKK